uniref:Protein eyes shut homolog n=1 Tax=Saccoglossus kowalevskii TaxID=10224 RepID=A0ABM0M0F4_SACKO|nr:PREDICTED: protein eyes shut homolog [Saccoglossus kowalevskii]
MSYECVCPVGYDGFYCNQVVTFTSARFNGKGYLYYELMDYNDLDKTITTLSFNISTIDNNGMILWMGQPNIDDNTDYLGIGIVDGRVKLSFRLGWLSYGTLYSDMPVVNGQWHSIIVNRVETSISLYVDGSPTPVYDIGGEFHELNTDGIYYIGGFSYNSDVGQLTQQLFLSPFQGCIRDIQVPASYDELNMMEPHSGANVQSCDNN